MLCQMRQIARYAAVRFNLKHFSVVNQYIGRERGTAVMRDFVRHINTLFDDKYEMTCRVGGDNFLAFIKSDKLTAVLDILSGADVICDENSGESICVSATAGVYTTRGITGRIMPTSSRITYTPAVAETNTCSPRFSS